MRTEEDYGSKYEFGKTGHFRAGIVNPGPGLGIAFGSGECRGRYAGAKDVSVRLAFTGLRVRAAPLGCHTISFHGPCETARAHLRVITARG